MTGDGPAGELRLEPQVHGFLDFLAAQGFLESAIYDVVREVVG